VLRCRAPSPLARKYRAPFRAQLRELGGRAAANARRHPGLIAVNWGATLVVAIGLGAQSRLKALKSAVCARLLMHKKCKAQDVCATSPSLLAVVQLLLSHFGLTAEPPLDPSSLSSLCLYAPSAVQPGVPCALNNPGSCCAKGPLN
jgi:hypothetical protein